MKTNSHVSTSHVPAATGSLILASPPKHIPTVHLWRATLSMDFPHMDFPHIEQTCLPGFLSWP